MALFYLTVRADFAAAHAIEGHPGKCARLHGHNYGLEVTVRGPSLNEIGILMDFADLKGRLRALLEELDHTNLNEHPAFQDRTTSAEHLSRFIYERLAEDLPEGVSMDRVTVHETERASATYRPDEGAPRR